MQELYIQNEIKTIIYYNSANRNMLLSTKQLYNTFLEIPHCDDADITRPSKPGAARRAQLVYIYFYILHQNYT